MRELIELIEKLKKNYEKMSGAKPEEALERAIKEVEDDFVFDIYRPAPNGAPARARIYVGKWVADCDAYPGELQCDMYEDDP